MATNLKPISRRGFLASAGTVAAVAALPAAAAGPALNVGRTAPWADRGALLDALRRAYFAELEAFATPLRPAFEAGELRASSSPTDDRIPAHEAPQGKLEALAAARFGLETTEWTDEGGNGWENGDDATAHAILAVSPHGESLDTSGDAHPALYAQEAVAWDVIALARSRGWYVPDRDEAEDPALVGTCDECGHRLWSHEEDGCHAPMWRRGDERYAPCDCRVPHTPHVYAKVTA